MAGNPNATAIAREYIVIASAFAAVFVWSHPVMWAVAFVVISTRQHALWMLFHDAVHGHLAKNHRWNDALASAFLGLPLGLVLDEFRPLHLVHHRELLTEADPERSVLYSGQPWRGQPLPLRKLMVQFAGDLLIFNNVRSLWLAWHERRSQKFQTRYVPTRPSHETRLIACIYLGVIVALYFWRPSFFWGFMGLWVLPLLTLSHLWHKLRSFAEHSADSTYSWRPGLLGRLTIWPYHINYHREHHENASIPWHRLPMHAQDQYAGPGSHFIKLLWNGSL